MTKQKTYKTKGLIAAPPTAFHPDGSVNLDIIQQNAAFLEANGVVGAFINGTTGEGLSLTMEERMSVAEQWVKHAPDNFKVIVHVAHTCPISTGELASHAARIGASAIGDIGPIFYKPDSVDSLVEHAAQTASHAAALPYYYYHLPVMNGINFDMYDFLRAAQPVIPNLAGIKHTHENFVDLSLCLEFNDGKYDILHGRDETLLGSLPFGCHGAVGSTYNIMAPLYSRLINAFNSGNFAEARHLQSLSIKIIRTLTGTKSFFSALKETMKLIGLDMGGIRSPLKQITTGEILKLRNDLTQTGFFEYCSKLK